jgi:hypothetical protein
MLKNNVKNVGSENYSAKMTKKINKKQLLPDATKSHMVKMNGHCTAKYKCGEVYCSFVSQL